MRQNIKRGRVIMGQVTLNDAIAKMKELDEKGFSCYFSGNGDGTVSAVAEGLFVKKEEKKK